MISRAVLKLIAPLVFWLTHRAFRSKYFNRSPRKHRWMMSCFRLAADSGHQQALSVYGHLLCLRGDSSKSKIQGGIYLEQAAQLGDMKACYQVAKLYEEGFEGYFVVDPDKALGYYRQAAEQNHALAVGRLADAYQEGELGLAVDSQASQQWRQRLPG